MSKQPTNVTETLEKSDTIPSGFSENYNTVLDDIKTKIKDSQQRAFSAVNRELLSIYWEIGKTIHHQQLNQEWGTSVVHKFARDLQVAFPGMKGLSSRNIWRMRDLYLSYHENEKLTSLLAEISWTHHIHILEKCKTSLEREFYIRMTKRNSWSYRVLLHQIESRAFEKTIVSQTNFEKNLPKIAHPDAKLALKDEYSFGFLELVEKHTERELERAIVNNMGEFLREIGSSYTFVGSQYQLEVDGHDYFIDILLYHRKLRSLVAIDLKIGSFIPEYIGKMQFYLSVLNDTVRLEGENPSIGIILCKEKNRTIVEYALQDTNKPIGVAAYKTMGELPEDWESELPSPEQISILLERLSSS